MQQDMRQQKQDMLDMKEDIKNTINSSITEKFNSLDIKNELMQKQIEEQSKKISDLERHIRRKNLVMFGVEEGEKSYQNLEDTVINILNTHLKIHCGSSNIEAVRRLGKKGEKIRPIIITFSTMGFKLQIKKNKSCLDNTSYYLKEDYPIEVLNKRKELQSQLLIEKEAGNTASYIKYDRLIVVSKTKDTPNYQSNKRNLSESPDNSLSHPSSHNVQRNRQPTKKNKPANIKDYILQKPKLTFTHTDIPQSPTKTQQLHTE